MRWRRLSGAVTLSEMRASEPLADEQVVAHKL